MKKKKEKDHTPFDTNYFKSLLNGHLPENLPAQLKNTKSKTTENISYSAAGHQTEGIYSPIIGNITICVFNIDIFENIGHITSGDFSPIEGNISANSKS